MAHTIGLLKKFLKSIKGKKSKQIDKIATEVHEEVFEKFDCLTCANCCKTTPPIVSQPDIKRISKWLGTTHSDFESSFTVLDEDGDRVMKTTPCVFLNQDNTCQIYEVRPKACRRYPHSDEYPFSSKVKLHSKNLEVCPAMEKIVSNIMTRIS